jgi:hypothetical protein
MAAMSDLPFPVQIVATHGHVPAEVLVHAEDVIRGVARLAPAPILFARVSIAHDDDPAVRRRVVAKASLDVNGRVVRAHLAAEHFDEALDLLQARLRRGLEVLAEHRQARRKGTGVSGAGEWRHGDLPTHRPPHHPRPQASREVVSRKSYILPMQSLEEAALDLELLDHDWVLFTWRETGQDVVLAYAEDGYRLLVPANRHAGAVAPVPRIQIDHGVPTLALREALQTLDLSGLPFVFFVDVDTGRGTVAYLRYDGHYGVVVPPGANRPRGARAGGRAGG